MSSVTQHGFHEQHSLPQGLWKSLFLHWWLRTLGGKKPLTAFSLPSQLPHSLSVHKTTLKAPPPSDWVSLWSQPSPQKVQSGWQQKPGGGLLMEMGNHRVPGPLCIIIGSPTAGTTHSSHKGFLLLVNTEETSLIHICA